MIPLVLLAALSGAIPPGLGQPSLIAFVGLEPTPPIACRLVESDRWSCDGPPGARGIVVIVGEQAIAFTTADKPGTPLVVRRWGRMLAIQSGAVSDEDLGLVRIAAWRPQASRFPTNRVIARPEPAIDVVRLMPGAFWITGNDVSEGTFVAIDGPGLASTRVAISTLTSGDLESPVVVAPTLASTLTGRVETASGDPVEGTDVELFEVAEPPADLTTDEILTAPMVRTGFVNTLPDGTFVFDRVGAGPLVVLVTDASRGRGRAVLRTPWEPALIRLTAPPRVSGRVVRNGTPVSGARVRLIPDPHDIAVRDIRDLAAPVITTGEDGRFAFPLPPAVSGVLQVLGPGGTSARASLPGQASGGDNDIGDITLPDSRRVAIRLIDGGACTLGAAGPLGALGIATVTESATAGIVHWLDLPEPGEWLLDADCGGSRPALTPNVVVVDEAGTPSVVDVQLARPR